MIFKTRSLKTSGKIKLFMALIVIITPFIFTGSAFGFHEQIDINHPLYEVCKTQHGSDPPSACVDAARQDSEQRFFGSEGILTTAAQLIVAATAVAAVIAIIIGGILYTLSGGSPEQVKKARDTIIYALVGLVIAAFGQTIILFVLSRL